MRSKIDDRKPVLLVTRLMTLSEGYRLVWNRDVYEGTWPELFDDAVEDQGFNYLEEPVVALDECTRTMLRWCMPAHLIRAVDSNPTYWVSVYTVGEREPEYRIEYSEDSRYPRGCRGPLPQILFKAVSDLQLDSSCVLMASDMFTNLLLKQWPRALRGARVEFSTKEKE